MSLHEAPDEVFNFWHECEAEGYTPSIDDFHERFGEEYPEWKHIFPDCRHELWGEISDEQFQTFDEMKYSGHKLSDFE